MNIVGRSEVRVDAFDKATGRTKYYDDLAPKDALIVRVKHSTIAHGFVKSVDISKAEKIPGVVKILTCFDVPDILSKYKKIAVVGGGIGTAITGWLLAASAFDRALAVQPDSCINMLKIMYLIIPFVLDAIITFILSRMKVEEANEKLRTELNH